MRLALAAVAFCGLIWFANKDRPVYRSSNMAGTDYEVGRVLRVVEDHKTVDEEMDGIWRGSMTLEVEILTGRYKGDTAIVENYFSSLYNVRVAEGDKVSIRIDTTGEDEYQVSVYNYYRVPQMIGCIVAFVLLLVLIGGKKGAKSVAGLAFTVVCILWILLPLALKGYSPLAVTIPADSGLQFCQLLPDRRHLDQDGCGGNRKHARCARGSGVCTDRAECHVDYDLPDG